MCWAGWSRSVSGQSLSEFFAARITGPLGMSDTAFEATGDKAARLAEPQADAATGARPPMRNVARPHRWASGGGGLVSTAADYLRFCQMLLNGGELDGVRLLAPKTVRHMASDHLPPGVRLWRDRARRASARSPRCRRWATASASAFAVRTQPGMSPVPGSVGEFFWGGVTGTYFWIDPAEELVAVFLLPGPRPPPLLPLPVAPAGLRRHHRPGAGSAA